MVHLSIVDILEFLINISNKQLGQSNQKVYIKSSLSLSRVFGWILQRVTYIEVNVDHAFLDLTSDFLHYKKDTPFKYLGNIGMLF